MDPTASMTLALYPGRPFSPGQHGLVSSPRAAPGFADISNAAQVSLPPRPRPMP